jgi:hypothetical protein
MRFSIRSLLILTAVVAFFCGLFFLLPDVPAALGIALVYLLTSTALISAITYARGYARAFAIGAVIPAAWTLIALYFIPMTIIWGGDWGDIIDVDTAIRFKAGFLIQIALMAMCGGTAVAMRRLCVGPARGATGGLHPNQQTPTETIDVRNRAELYRIIEGRMNSPTSENGDGPISTIADAASENSRL